MRVTRAGLVLIGTAVGLLAVGIALGFLVLVVLGVAALIGVAAGAVTVLRRPELVVRRDIHPVRVARGELAVGRVQVHNPTRRTSAAGQAVEQVGVDTTTVRVPRLRGGQTRTVSYSLPTARRGVLDVGPLLVDHEDPLGLVAAGSREGDVVQLHVHPRVHPVRLPATGRTAHLDGPTSDSAPRGSITFHTLREYVVGDDLRRVHWRSTARLGSLMVREYVDTSLPRTGVVLDTRRDAYATPADFEEAVDIAASLLSASVRAGWPVRLLGTAPLGVSPRGGTAAGGLDVGSTGRSSVADDLAAVLDRLSEVQPVAAATSPVLTARSLPPGTCLALVSGAGGPGGSGGDGDGAMLGALAGLRRRHDRVVLLRVRQDGPAGDGPAGDGPAGDGPAGDGRVGAGQVTVRVPVPGVQVLSGPTAATLCRTWDATVAR